MTFWQLNKSRFLITSVLLIGSFFCFFYYAGSKTSDSYDRITLAIIGSLVIYTMVFFAVYMGVINCFRVISRLTNDISDYSILPLFDAPFTIQLKNEHSWFLFITPQIHATVSGLPVIISYIPSDRSRASCINFTFTPLMKESKRIYSTTISFKLYFARKLRKDIKPEVLQCVAEAKKNGLVSGAARTISTLHYEQYED